MNADSLVAVHRLVIVVASLVRGTGFRVRRLQSLWHVGSVGGIPGLRAQAQKLWCTGLVVPQHVGSFWIRDQTHVSCVGRQILYH